MNLRQPTSKGNRGIAKSHSKHSITPIRSVNVASPQNPFQIHNKENNAKSFLQKVTGDPNQQSQQSMKSNASLPCGLTINSKPISGLHSVSQSRFNAATDIDARPTTTTSLTLSGVNPISRNSTISSFGSTISNLTLSNASFSNNLNLGQTSFQHSSYSSEAELQKLLKNQRIFEKFILDAMKRPLADCVEDLLTDIFHAKDVIFWQDIPSLHMMYSKKLDLVASHSDGLVGYEFFQRSRLILEYPGEHPAYKEDFDKIEGDIPLSLLTFTLFDNNGNVSAVVQIKRIRSNPFTDTQELSFLDYFEEKFPIFFPLYDKVNLQQDVICKMLQEMDIDQFLLHFQKQMVTIFSCRSAEIWKLDQAEHVLHLYKKAKSVVDWSRGGIASEAIDRRYPLNCISNRMMSSYNEDVDGREIESVLCVPLSDLKRNTVHCIVLRGGPEKKVFTSADQTMLQLITPYCVLAMNNIEDEEKNRKSSENEDIEIKGKRCLEALKTIIEQLENKTEIEDIIARVIENLELLTHAERSTLLTVNNKSDMMLNNVFSTSPKFPKTIEPNRTYVARAIELGQVFNIGDCYDEIDFDSSLDLVTNYHTRSLLAVPMKNGKSECFGVVEFCNRTGNTVFPNSDVPFVKIIMNTLGLLIDNRKLENEVVTSSEQLRNFISVSLSTISNSVLQDVFRNILTNINRENNFESSAIFIYNNMRENLTSFISSGEKLQRYLPLSHGFPALAFKSKEVIFSNDALHDSRYVRDPCDSSGVDIRSICIAPIVSFTGNKVFGVLEATNKKNGEHYSAKDINVLRSVATLVALSLENRSMDAISEYGNAEFEIDKWVEEVEKPE
ncbi:hypothetical protein TRFO_23941 [Tritrichomonas foetus]|uniref:GAF domain-containing protein n=1 Tax=Tritrichomonas foetus TaxID=1144522 RepID=A0A1J4K962_9EUKA|nr:hypothetical protein TRFO_23941 [Tritrichomonas foetus]|eukprot:OHT07755.1 hypothetical protein TRFO_23941 [Tritrichomonas foetus]